jgi:phosphoglycolate phosphatase
MKIKTDVIFFDLDGVLIDSREALSYSLDKAFEKHGIRKLRLGEISEFIGPPLHDSLAKFLRKEGFSESLMPILVDECRDIYGKEGMRRTVLFSGVPETLEYFMGKKKTMFVTTVKPVSFAEPILRGLGIRKYFKGVIGTVDMNRRELEKMEVVKMALAKANPDSAVIVGDRESDIKAGKKYGIKTVGVTYGVGTEEEIRNAKPDAIARSIKELKEIIA